MEINDLTTKINLQDIETFFDFLGHEEETEIRCCDPAKKELPHSFFCRDWDSFREACIRNNGIWNIYAGLNERPKGQKSGVKSITCIGHDLDCHGSDSNMEVAKEVALKIKEDFIKMGYQEPLIMCSGYGYWVIHRCEPIPNTSQNIEKIKHFGRKVKERYEKPGVEFDSAVYDPSRIARIPGTLNLRDNQPRLSFCLNHPSYFADFKLKEDIIAIQLPNYANFVSVEVPKDGCQFMNYCLSHCMPIGERHTIISRNMSIYISGKSNIEELKRAYIVAQNGKSNELDNWLNSLNKNQGKKYPFSCGQLINYQKKYGIPLQCENCKLFKDFNKGKCEPKGWGRILSISKVAQDKGLLNCPECNAPLKFVDSYGFFKCEACEGVRGGLKAYLKLAILQELNKGIITS